MYMHIYSHILLQKYIYVNNMCMHAIGVLQSQTRISPEFYAACCSCWFGKCIFFQFSFFCTDATLPWHFLSKIHIRLRFGLYSKYSSPEIGRSKFFYLTEQGSNSEIYTDSRQFSYKQTN